MHKLYNADHTVHFSAEPLPAGVMNTVTFLRRSANVTRYHTEEMLRPQTVGQHSYGVAWLCYVISGGDPSRDLLLAALAHDAAEHSLGDIPSPTKRALGIRERVDALESTAMSNHGVRMPVLVPEDALTLKLADALDGVLHCLRERELGNVTIRQVFVNFVNYVSELKPNGRASKILDYAVGRWNELSDPVSRIEL